MTAPLFFIDMKNINTLVEDIYKLFEVDNKSKLSQKQIEKYFDSPTRIKFLYGHLLESLLLTLTRLAGHEVTEEQKEINIAGVLGHQDCRIDDMLVDVKSASGNSFKKFASGRLSEDDPFGYIGQLSAYAEDKQDKEAAFFVIDKQNGNLKRLLKKIRHLVGVISLYLMVQVGTISFLLVAFTVRISILAGLILMEVKDFVVSNMQKAYGILQKLRERLMF